MMNWQELYSNKRFRETSTVPKEPGRGDYIRDYDRVIFSSPFRKLQNKTQVFPLPGAFFVHNRLTHSLEVASVGRSLGKFVGDALADKYANVFSKNSNDFYRFELSDVIQTACLAHDIGNPPFGHFGEEAIRSFFEDFFQKNGNLDLTENQVRDFTKFEGNANAFRILTELFARMGLKITYTTLASVVKYPSSSSKGFNKERLNTKKSGFFDGETSYFENIAKELGIPGADAVFARHPFVYLVEAADDICYRIIDLEDAFKLNVIHFSEVLELLYPLLEGSSMLAYLDKKLAELDDDEQKLSLLRALLVNHLTKLCTEAFFAHEEEILNGTLNNSLIDLLDEPYKSQIKKVDKFSINKIYNSHTVIEKELAGYHAIYGLLEEFIGALLLPELHKSKKLMCLLPNRKDLNGNLYSDIMTIVDYVSQMTDDYAMEIFRKIRGSF